MNWPTLQRPKWLRLNWRKCMPRCALNAVFYLRCVMVSVFMERVESTCCYSARRIFNYWLARTTPEMAYKLAVAAFSNNDEYLRLKREIKHP